MNNNNNNNNSYSDIDIKVNAVKNSRERRREMALLAPLAVPLFGTYTKEKVYRSWYR